MKYGQEIRPELGGILRHGEVADLAHQDEFRPCDRIRRRTPEDLARIKAVTAPVKY